MKQTLIFYKDISVGLVGSVESCQLLDLWFDTEVRLLCGDSHVHVILTEKTG